MTEASLRQVTVPPPDGHKVSGRKRVLVVEPAGLLWGSERALLDLLREVDRTRFDLTVACPPDSPLLPHLDDLGIARKLLPLGSLHMRGRTSRVLALLAITKLLARLRPSVVHLNQCGIVNIAAVPSAILGIPVVAHVRIAEDVALLRDRVPQALAPRIAIAISADMAHQLENAVSEVRLVYDPYAPVRPSRDRTDVRNSLCIPLDAPLICIASRLGPGKRHDLLLLALKMLPDPQAHLLIVGGDAPTNRGSVSHADSLRSMVWDLGLERRVTFTGMRDDVIDILAASDLAALPSDNEPFGRVLLEALSLGVPVVAADAGGPREIIGSGERGFLFTPGDAAGLAVAIAEALANRDEAAKRTAAGTEWVHHRCSPAAHARAVEKIYDLVVAETGGSKK